jgi:hypothetical protein
MMSHDRDASTDRDISVQDVVAEIVRSIGSERWYDDSDWLEYVRRIDFVHAVQIRTLRFFLDSKTDAELDELHRRNFYENFLMNLQRQASAADVAGNHGQSARADAPFSLVLYRHVCIGRTRASAR